MSDKLIERIEECISVHLEDTASLSYERLKHKNQYDLDVLRDCKQRIEGLETKIDSLMLEFCSNEMTEEQLDNWGNHQRMVKHTPPEGENK